MRAWAGLAVLVSFVAVAAAAPAARRAPAPAAFAPGAGHAAGTRCAACHTVKSWTEVRFNHERTGFPLRGQHAQARCRDCHVKDFTARVPDTCSGCHRDRHAGELGLHCEGCHDESSWRPLFEAAAHRRTTFPLTGKHAVIPCQQCHGNLRDRAFEHAPLACAGCHAADYDRTKGKAIDHLAAGFSKDCQGCHGTWSFKQAQLEGHDACFRISGGPHRGIACASCHSPLPMVRLTGACNTGTATCTACHEHECARTDRQHRDVMGYECRDRKCYECHR
jgi:hypothetical protein